MRASREKLTIVSPGRINLIGEHTDYNMGFVMPAAIDKAMRFDFEKVDGDLIQLVAQDLNESFEFSSNDLTIGMPDWAKYCAGIIDQLNKKNLEVDGFKCCFGGNIPLGAGLSSSAALGCGFLFGINEMFGLSLTRLEIAQIAQKSENEYVGVNCGIMDQYACVFGQPNSFVKIDCRSLDHEVVTGDFDGYQVILCDTNVKHSLASTEYNTRRSECEQGVEAINRINLDVHSLRDASLHDLEEVRNDISPAVYDRCKYVICENDRVVKAVKAIHANDMDSLGQLMFDSHDGLSNLYKVSCEELDVLADFAKSHDGVLGARMMGGGFGGCTINLVKSDQVEQFKADVSKHFKEKTGTETTIYDIMISTGVHIEAQKVLED